PRRYPVSATVNPFSYPENPFAHDIFQDHVIPDRVRPGSHCRADPRRQRHDVRPGHRAALRRAGRALPAVPGDRPAVRRRSCRDPGRPPTRPRHPVAHPAARCSINRAHGDVDAAHGTAGRSASGYSAADWGCGS
ncbi:hypothetical protein LZ30DRAFT_818470, partial [Colletotrichum cereale]